MRITEKWANASPCSQRSYTHRDLQHPALFIQGALLSQHTRDVTASRMYLVIKNIQKGQNFGTI